MDEDYVPVGWILIVVCNEEYWGPMQFGLASRVFVGRKIHSLIFSSFLLAN
jgi:hypothetical protein